MPNLAPPPGDAILYGRARRRNQERIVIGIDDAGEDGIAACTVQAAKPQASMCAAPFLRKTTGPAHRGQSIVRSFQRLPGADAGSRMGKLPQLQFPAPIRARLEPERRGRIARTACRCGGDAPQFWHRGAVSAGRRPSGAGWRRSVEIRAHTSTVRPGAQAARNGESSRNGPTNANAPPLFGNARLARFC
jgi:hypothetical protein